MVEDDAKIARLVATYLERASYRVAVATDGMSGLRMIRELSPALVVLDLMLPELDGRSVAQTAREEGDVSIIILTALSSTANRISGLELGADDYVAKPFEPAELVARVRSVLRRSRPLGSTTVLRHADLVVDPARRVAQLGNRTLPLTALEFDLLHALIQARGRVLTREHLTNVLFRASSDACIHERSIDVYVQRLRGKLGDEADRPRYISTVRGVGYRLAT
ncbi:MAG: response regulator [Candidatus Dormibacterales bacterium]